MCFSCINISIFILLDGGRGFGPKFSKLNLKDYIYQKPRVCLTIYMEGYFVSLVKDEKSFK